MNHLGTSTDQKLTCDEACAEASALGFTEVQTHNGWQSFSDWLPYGSRTHKAVSFRLETRRDNRPAICERPLVPADSDKYFFFGVWYIR